MDFVGMEPDQWQLGRTKVFIKNPESLFLLEEQRERKFDQFARRIQIFYRRWKAQQYYEELKVKASDIMMHKKERRPGTINRNFVGDYIGFGDNPSLRSLVGKKAVRCCAARFIHAGIIIAWGMVCCSECCRNHTADSPGKGRREMGATLGGNA